QIYRIRSSSYPSCHLNSVQMSRVLSFKSLCNKADQHLAKNEYLAGSEYSIADIAAFPWYGGLVKNWVYNGAEFLGVDQYKNVQRWADAILARPAVQRGRMVNRTFGDLATQLHERHDASDFETKTQDKLQNQS
ncbi:glutathione binding-like protein, partial [Acinetobacter baumannii]|nr:glutathione binding-like protein [Acinetobacter baumannii]